MSTESPQQEDQDLSQERPKRRYRRHTTVKTAKDFANLNIPLRTVRRGDPEISAKERNLYDHRYAQLIDALLSLPTETLRDQLYHHYEESGEIDPDMPDEPRETLIERTVERLLSTHLRAPQEATHGSLPLSSPALRTYWMAYTFSRADRLGLTTRSRSHAHTPWSAYSICPDDYKRPNRGPYTANLPPEPSDAWKRDRERVRVLQRRMKSEQMTDSEYIEQRKALEMELTPEEYAKQGRYAARTTTNPAWDRRRVPNGEHFRRMFVCGNHEEGDAYSADQHLLKKPGQTVSLDALNDYARVMETAGLLEPELCCWARSGEQFADTFWQLPSLITMVWAWESLTEQVAHVRQRENTLRAGEYDTLIQLSPKWKAQLSKKRVTLEGGTYAKFREVMDDAPTMNPFALPDMFKQQYISLGGEKIRELGCNGATTTPVSAFNPHELLPDSIQQMRVGRAMSERALHEMTRKHGRVITRTRLAQMRTEPHKCHPTLEEISILCGVFRIKLSWWLWGITSDYALYRST